MDLPGAMGLAYSFFDSVDSFTLADLWWANFSDFDIDNK
jgi:hypothetical protein